MPNIRDHIVKIETALILRDAGIGQNTLFYYIKGPDFTGDNGETVKRQWAVQTYLHKTIFEDTHKGYEYVAAHTASELAPLIPFTITRDGREWYCNSMVGHRSKGSLVVNTNYGYDENDCETKGGLPLEMIGIDFDGPTYAEAYAKMLLWLIAEGYVNVQK